MRDQCTLFVCYCSYKCAKYKVKQVLRAHKKMSVTMQRVTSVFCLFVKCKLCTFWGHCYYSGEVRIGLGYCAWGGEHASWPSVVVFTRILFICETSSIKPFFVINIHVLLSPIMSLAALCEYTTSSLPRETELTSHHGYIITYSVKCEMKLFINSQTSTTVPLTFGYWWIISSYTL